MKSLQEHMASYSAYHRQSTNKAIHYVCVPVIVWATMGLLGQWTLITTAGLAITPALLASALVLLYYLRLDTGLGIACVLLFTFLLGTSIQVQTNLGAQAVWVFAGVFVAAWIGQLLGHAVFEKRKPALADNLFQVLVAPIFVVAEWAFALGLRKELKASLETP